MRTPLLARSRALALGAVVLGALTVSPFLAGCDAADPAAAPTASTLTLDARAGEGFATLRLDPATGETVRGQAERVAICHYDADAATYERLEVGAPALPAHLRHGDGAPGGAAPGGTFDDACGIVTVPEQPFTCETEPGVDEIGRNTLTVTATVVDPAYLPVDNVQIFLGNSALSNIEFTYEGGVLVGAAATFAQVVSPSTSTVSVGLDGPNIAEMFTCGPYVFGAP